MFGIEVCRQPQERADRGWSSHHAVGPLGRGGRVARAGNRARMTYVIKPYFHFVELMARVRHNLRAAQGVHRGWRLEYAISCWTRKPTA